MARGIDFYNVNTVIQYDFPRSSVEYIHRVGRAGRMSIEGQRRGVCVTFFTEEDRKVKKIAKVIKNSGGNVPKWLQ